MVEKEKEGVDEREVLGDQDLLLFLSLYVKYSEINDENNLLSHTY